MADVKARAQAEAERKGLSGPAEQAYVGGVFNKIRQAHARATTPGKGAAHLNRKARVASRAQREEMKEAIRAMGGKPTDPSYIRPLTRRTPSGETVIVRPAPITLPLGKRELKAPTKAELRRLSDEELQGQSGREAREYLEGGGFLNPIHAARARAYTEEEIRRRPKAAAPKAAAPKAARRGLAEEAKGIEAPPKAALAGQARVSVRATTYHGKDGYLISGKDATGGRVSIFSATKTEAERMRDDIKAGREPRFDVQKPKPAPKPKSRIPADNTPLVPLPGTEGARFDPFAPIDPDQLRRIYGQEQLPKALRGFSRWELQRAARAKGLSDGGSSEQLIARLSREKPAPTSAKPAEPPALSFKERGRLFQAQRAREQRERDETAKAQHEARYLRNQALKRAGYTWHKFTPTPGGEDPSGREQADWYLEGPDGKEISESAALARIGYKAK